MGTAVQFRGMDAVLQAYEDRAVPSWALFQFKQFLMPCVTTDIKQGYQTLQELLRNLENGGTNAVYTLKVYEDIPGGKIKENTPSDGSFNFQLNAESMTLYQGRERYVNSVGEIRNLLESRLAAIERQLIEKPEPEAEPTTLDKILEFSETSAGKMIVGTLLGAMFKQPVNNYQAAAISGIPDIGGEEKILQAIEILKRYDPLLPDHLYKLAQIAEADSATFKMLIGMLDKL